MLQLHCKYLEHTEKPPSGSFTSPLRLVRVLTDDDVLTVVADEAVFEGLAEYERLDDLVLHLSLRRFDLASLGGKGAAYRLRAVGVGSIG